MIEIEDLRFAYPEGGFALDVHRLQVGQGHRRCWIGPSGSGKTTLLHLVAGILRADTGKVTTCGTELTSLSNSANRNFRISNVGLVFQDFALLDYLNVLDNILLPYRINRALSLDATVRTRAAELAMALGLGERLARRPTQLSQGERQRVAVCRAILTNPKLLLADEPTANLDRDNADRVLDALDDYSDRHQATLIVVSHDRDVMSQFHDKTDISEFCVMSSIAADGEGDHA